MSTPIFSPWRSSSRSSSGTAGSPSAGPGMFTPLRDRAVGEVEDRTGFNGLGEAGPANPEVVCIPLPLLAAAADQQPLADPELDDPAGKGADPELRSGQVLEEGNRSAGRRGGLPDQLGRPLVGLKGAVGVVEA